MSNFLLSLGSATPCDLPVVVKGLDKLPAEFARRVCVSPLPKSQWVASRYPARSAQSERRVRFAAGFKLNRPHRERTCHAHQQTTHMVIVPHPTALEVGKLKLALDDISEDLGKQTLGSAWLPCSSVAIQHSHAGAWEREHENTRLVAPGSHAPAWEHVQTLQRRDFHR